MTGVVIAGGRSSRMDHREKALLDLAGEPMLGRVIDRLRPQVGRMVINANGDPARFSKFGLPMVADDAPEGFMGPLAGLYTGLDWAGCKTPEVSFVASAPADTPFLPLDLVARLKAAAIVSGTGSAIAASGGRAHPIVGVWRVDLSGAARDAIIRNVRAMHQFAEEQKSAVVAFAPVKIGGEPIDPFFNVNTPEDLERARALLAAEQARG